MNRFIDSLVLNEEKLPPGNIQMTEKHLEKLQANHEKLVEEIEIKTLMPYLYSKQAADENVYEEVILDSCTTRKGAQIYLLHLRKRADNNFFFLCEALRCHHQQWFLDVLVDDEDRHMWEESVEREQYLLDLDKERIKSEETSFKLRERKQRLHDIPLSYPRAIEPIPPLNTITNDEITLKMIDTDITSPKTVEPIQDNKEEPSNVEHPGLDSQETETYVKEVVGNTEVKYQSDTPGYVDDTKQSTASAATTDHDDQDDNDDNQVEVWGTPPQTTEILYKRTFEIQSMRNYQLELAQFGLQGCNCIICAPTGCGKTRVAAYLIDNHIKTRSHSKVLFFAPTVALVRQQFEELRNLLPEIAIDILVGPDAPDRPPLEVLVERNQLVCVTPAILVNALMKQKINTLEMFSLLVFDECHHTQRTEQYNQIMGHYQDTKFSVELTNLPQIVGMTASLGVGEANIKDSAVRHIITICANLDTSKICVVKENLDELRQYVNDPQEDMLVIPAKINDPFASVIQEAMKQIEGKIKSFPESGQVNLSTLEFPTDRHKPWYVNFLSDVRWKLSRLPQQETDLRRNVNACLNDLQAYYRGLIMHFEARAKDAIKIIEREFERPWIDLSEGIMTAVERWLQVLYNDKILQLRQLSEDPECTNPKLIALKRVILDTYAHDTGIYSILFTKTRESTEALKAWMLEDPELSFLNPERLTGIASQEESGMTSRKQESVVKSFKEGLHKILIATSAAEEGLDIKECSVVFRHNYSTNEVGRVQSKGRARKPDSKFITTTTVDRPELEERDRMNLYREGLMKAAIEKISQMPEELLKLQIKDIQHASKEEREYKKEQMLKRQSMKSTESYRVVCFNCATPMCNSTDIVCFGGFNHIVASKEFDETKFWVCDPRKRRAPSNFQKLYKIFCKKCRHNWGVIFKFQGKVEFPTLKSQAIALFKGDGGGSITGPEYKKWDDMPVKFRSVEEKELCELFKGKHYQLSQGQ